jgi:rsbT co-antagonist protein RsbR
MNISLLQVVDEQTLIVVNANKAALRTMSHDQMVGRNLYDMIPPSNYQQYQRIVQQCLQSRTTTSNEYAFNHPDGSRFWVLNTMVPLVNEQGEVPYLLSISQDFTAWKEQELELIAQREIIERQTATLTELSTPLLSISEDTVVMPLIGTIDTLRVNLLTISLLEGVAHNQAKNVIIDITGVPVVDTQVANALISAGNAVKLMGARVILTGIRPEVAQVLVSLGITFNEIVTYATLQTAITALLR